MANRKFTVVMRFHSTHFTATVDANNVIDAMGAATSKLERDLIEDEESITAPIVTVAIFEGAMLPAWLR